MTGHFISHQNNMHMEQLNRAVVRGIVGSIRVTEVGDTKAARMSVATNFAYKAKDGTCILETTWHAVSLFEGKNISGLDTIAKGDRVEIEGRLRNQRYIGADGIERTTCEILASKLVKLPSDEPFTMDI